MSYQGIKSSLHRDSLNLYFNQCKYHTIVTALTFDWRVFLLWNHHCGWNWLNWSKTVDVKRFAFEAPSRHEKWTTFIIHPPKCHVIISSYMMRTVRQRRMSYITRTNHSSVNAIASSVKHQHTNSVYVFSSAKLRLLVSTWHDKIQTEYNLRLT